VIKKLKLGIGNMGVRFIRFTARKAKLDLIRIAYSENGLTKSYSLEASGEEYFTQKYLPSQLGDSPILFDVGGNKGAYSALLHKSFPTGTIHVFEPNPNTFKVLSNNLGNSAVLNNYGIGAASGALELFFDAQNKTSEQATSDPEILKTIAKTNDLVSEKIKVITLDEYCSNNAISKIDFLKIDTEGFELEALQGAGELLKNKAIKIIQFEFNEVNIVKRRFLKDFYELLDGFTFYRLDTNELIELGEWQPIHEIFMFQNIIAIQS
jgi:FkbM family methyltransferase